MASKFKPYRLRKSTDGKFYWSQLAPNGNILGRSSQMYDSIRDLKRGLYAHWKPSFTLYAHVTMSIKEQLDEMFKIKVKDETHKVIALAPMPEYIPLNLTA